MTFLEFLYAYHDGTLDQNVTWRAYDIPSVALRRVYILGALKMLKLAYAGELAIPEFMARYGIGTPDEAQAILGAWWVWSAIDAGRPLRVPKRAIGRLDPLPGPD